MSKSSRSADRVKLAKAGLFLLGALFPPGIEAAAPFSGEHLISSVADGVGQSIAVDLDRDGDLDVVATLDDDAAIAWYENDGAQTFSLHTLLSISPNSTAVAAGDIDGDGDVDLVSTSSSAVLPSWWQNNGAELFTERALTGIPRLGWNGLALGDLDRDGDLDVVVTSFNEDTIVWYENSGSDTFVGEIVSSTALLPGGVEIGDLDGDGDLDFAVATSDDDTVAWYENDGAAAFSPHPVASDLNGAADAALADVNGDGDLDVLSASSVDNTIAWHENFGLMFTEFVVSTSALRTMDVEGADVDGDGDADLLSASFNDDTFSWFENNGDQAFTERILTFDGDGAKSLTAADIDGDGDLDLLAASTLDDTLAWYENLAPRSTAELSSAVDLGVTSDGPSGIDAGDLDDDGKIDVVLAAENEDSVTWYRHGIDANPQVLQIAFGSAHFVDGVESAEFFDLDGDGDLDILTAAGLGDDVAWHETVALFPLVVEHHLIDGSADDVRYATAGDLDGDGDLDVVAAVRVENTVTWYRNDGSGSFSSGIVAAAGVLAVRSVSPGDLDGDGDLDIAFAESGGTQLGWLQSNGAVSPTFTRRTIADPFDAPFWVRIGDFDGDGRMDLLATSFSNDKVAWFRNMGGSPPNFLLASTHSNVLGAAEIEPVDLDRDGDLDFLVAARDADRVYWFENPGPLQFPRARPLPPALDGALCLAAADFDSDGTLDLAVASSFADSVSFLANRRAIFWDDLERGDTDVWSASVP